MKLQADKYIRENISGAAWWLTSPEARPWLLLWGKYGNGKTTLGDSVMETINTYMSLEMSGGFSSSDLKKYSSMEKISAIEVGQASREDSEMFQKIISKPKLFIDDWGTEPNIVNNYGTVISPMANLIFYRYEHRLMTVISANMTISQIEKYYGLRISDRITEVCDMIGFNQKSYRK